MKIPLKDDSRTTKSECPAGYRPVLKVPYRAIEVFVPVCVCKVFFFNLSRFSFWMVSESESWQFFPTFLSSSRAREQLGFFLGLVELLSTNLCQTLRFLDKN